jgi:hypothetical protein
MASTYSTNLRLEMIASGEQSGTWDTTNNTNLGTLIEEAISGVSAVTHDDSAAYSLTTNNGSTDEARQMVLTVGGTLTAARNLVCPTSDKVYIVHNATTGGYAVTLKTTAGTGISVPNGKVMWLYCDGTNVVDAVTHLSSLTLATVLDETQGGTGLTAFTAGDIIYASSANTLAVLAKGTATQVVAMNSGATAPEWVDAPDGVAMAIALGG